MKVLILTSVVSDTTAYAPGDKVTLSDADALKLIRGGFALKLVELDSAVMDAITDAAAAAEFTSMPTPTGTIPPSGGYYWSGNQLHLIHPSGGKALIDPLHVLPGWSP